MNIGAKVGFGLLGFLLGGVAGTGAGLCLGLAYTTLADTSGFEGYSGFVVAYWMLGGLLAGAIGGAILLPRYVGKRRQAK
jgi:hypothetical protein